jgi:hypothetical protein
MPMTPFIFHTFPSAIVYCTEIYFFILYLRFVVVCSQSTIFLGCKQNRSHCFLEIVAVFVIIFQLSVRLTWYR